MPTTRSRYLPTRWSKAATSPPCTRPPTARSASASGLRSGDATRVFSSALLAFIRRWKEISGAGAWQIEKAPRASSCDGPERGHLPKQGVPERKQLVRGGMTGPFGKGRARGVHLARHGRLYR